MVAITAEAGSDLMKIAWFDETTDLLGFEVLVMTASAIGVGSRKEEKAKRRSASQEILLRCYMRLRPGSQELCVYLEIKRLRRGKPIS